MENAKQNKPFAGFETGNVDKIGKSKKCYTDCDEEGEHTDECGCKKCKSISPLPEECKHDWSKVVMNHPSGTKIGDKMCTKCNLVEPLPEEKDLVDWEEKEYLANLHFLIGDRTEHEWVLILGIIQGKIHHEISSNTERVKNQILDIIDERRETSKTHEYDFACDDIKEDIINKLK